MEWRKLKNLIILILLMVNGFLLVLVWSRREEAASYQRAALEQTVQVLEKNGIEVDLNAVVPADDLHPLTVERDLDRELQMARGLLGGSVRADNWGGGLYVYRNEAGGLNVRAGGELSAELERDDRWAAAYPERHAAGLLEDMGVQAEPLDPVREDGQTRLRFRQVWNGAPVFSCQVELAYKDDELTSLHGTLVAGSQGTAEAGDILTLPTALMRFSEEIAAAGDVCTAVRSMEPGYRGTAQPLSGVVRLTPVWLVTTDTARYYLDCISGALTRAE